MDNQRLKQLLSFFKEGSRDPFIQYAIATEYLKENQIDLALQFYEGLLKNHPDYIGTYYHIGKLYGEIGRREDAKAVFEKGIAKAKEIRDAHALSELQQVYQLLLLDLEEED